MSKFTGYGPGDPETWGPCTNHPGDPRLPDPYEPTDDDVLEFYRTSLDEDMIFEIFEDSIENVDTEIFALIQSIVLNQDDIDERIKTIRNAFIDIGSSYFYDDVIEMLESRDE